MDKKKGLTVDRHWVTGARLKTIRDAFQTLCLEVSHAYPLQSPQVRELERALDAIMEARSALDTAVCQEVPDEYTPRTYYPALGMIEVKEGKCQNRSG